ncbi:MAG: hypothetical protein H6740_27715 [Alphaproteobacteria bacterium]|nr:hypothetical protein [Alphaproteobacteria bacterium]
MLKAIREGPGLRLAQDLSAEEIDAALAATGEISMAAFELGVSAHGLKLRMNALGLSSSLD